MTGRFYTLTAAALLTAACAAGRPSGSAMPGERQAPPSNSWPDSIRWVETSAEYAASTIQTFRVAAARVEQAAAGRAPRSWAVVVDADDTIINNVPYQAGLARDGVRHTPERFTAWVRRRASTPVPGARSFLEKVRALGGRIAVVTNRLAVECDDTRENLRLLGLDVDAVLCRPPDDGAVADKRPRFTAIAEGRTPVSAAPLEILAFVGDNILDFPAGRQSLRAEGDRAFDEFGVRWFILPNPMYGSWQ